MYCISDPFVVMESMQLLSHISLKMSGKLFKMSEMLVKKRRNPYNRRVL
ncbi:hypothetical protein HMPREF9555_01198 [Selenomonas artemidis F0399]|uniref:Uncharacterized protein n=1 Tax=Selenomonas artemidis F0399 TaxID=749551 RepID=E7N2I2_9FIRM|nr:hypothetical protein HMPREF9555_01198 [Selenomonas artemidis F0399]EJP32901.1 hypothetical protein HMPREF1147_0330 [Selenomonas sp. FOBRC9]